MKYRVKFECYWYNTGIADNHHYINFQDFDTLKEAEEFNDRVHTQKENGPVTIEIENGFITGYGKIIKFFPEREEDF